MSLRHWVTVYVQVPVESDNPSPMVAEREAWKLVEKVLAVSAPTMRVSAVQWSRQEPRNHGN